MDSAITRQVRSKVQLMRSFMKPLVIIPTYNERDNVSGLIPAILNVDSRIHILIVDDASPDHTAEKVRELIGNAGGASRLFLESRPGKSGLGSAYVHGFTWGLARGYDFLIEMDADWSHDPEDLRTMLELARKADFVVGSRYVPRRRHPELGCGQKAALEIRRRILPVDPRVEFLRFYRRIQRLARRCASGHPPGHHPE